MANERHYPRNDGGTSIDYQLLGDPKRNAHLSEVLNEACHVFHWHADGNWASLYKDKYARLVGDEIAHEPSLAPRLLATGDRVIKMVTYRALELAKGDGPGDGDAE